MPTTDYTNDFILVLNNQLIACSYTDRVVYISSDESYLDFSNAGDYVAGDPDFAVLDEFPKGGITRGDSAYIGAGVNSWYEVTPNTTITYVQSEGRTVITKVTKFAGSGLTAPLGKNFVTASGEDIIFLDQENQLRTLGFYRNIYAQKSPSLSLEVRQELEQQDFTGGCLRSIGEYTYITSPVSGRTYLYQIRDDVDDVGNISSLRQWQPFQDWNISRLSIVEGIVHGYSADYPQLFQLWDTEQWVDDTSVADEYAPYVSRARWAYQQVGARDEVGAFDKVFFEGYILEGSDLVANVYYDYQGSTKIVQAVISSTTQTPVLYTSDNVNLVGDSIVGAETIGGGLNDENYPINLPKFRAIADVQTENVFEFQPELVSETAGSRWEIVCLGANPTKAAQSPTVLKISSVVISD